MVGSSYFDIAYRRKEEGMASTLHRQRRILSRARLFSGVLGASLLGLLLAAPLSWSQPIDDVTILEVSIIVPGSGEIIDSDCFRLAGAGGRLVHGSCDSATYSRSGCAGYRLLRWRSRSKQWHGGWGYC